MHAGPWLKYGFLSPRRYCPPSGLSPFLLDSSWLNPQGFKAMKLLIAVEVSFIKRRKKLFTFYLA